MSHIRHRAAGVTTGDRVRTWGYIGALAAGGMLSGVAAAQGSGGLPDRAAAPVAVGMRVRIWQRVASDLSVPVTGTLTRLTSDTVALRPDGLADPVALPRPAIARVERSQGPHSAPAASSAWKGAIVGAIGGAVLGAVVGDLARRNAAKIAIGGLVVGGGIGAGVGAASPGEAWQRSVLPPAVGQATTP